MTGRSRICALAAVLVFQGAFSLVAKEAPRTPKPEPVPPVADASIVKAMDRGVAFLVSSQNENGSWGSPRRTKGLNIFAPVPGSHHAFRDATTALCVNALNLVGVDDNPDAVAAMIRGEDFLLENLPNLRRATPTAIYNVWGHIYGIQCMAAMHQRKGIDDARRKRIREVIAGQLDLLERYASVDGGWGYYDFRLGTKQPASSSISFVNAAGLVALHDAREIGVEIPERLWKRAYAATQRQRFPDNSYAYGEYLKMRPRYGINRPGGSLGRSQACNVALRLWGDETVTEEVFVTWLDRLAARNGWLDIGRKRPIPHESWFAVAGYFFYFGHFYAGRCIDVLDPAVADPHRDQLATILLKLQEKDGSWWDYPLYSYHQPYGTGYALMTLHYCRKGSE